MASKGKRSARDQAIFALRRLTRDRPEPSEQWRTLLATYGDKADDSLVALIFGSAVEQALEDAISTHFVLDEAGCALMFDDAEIAPIGTFAAKTRVAYALGIFEKHIRDEIDMIRFIRNSFAHAKRGTDFDTEQIANGCTQLFIPTVWTPFSEKTPGVFSIPTPDTNRGKYMLSARFLFMYLLEPEFEARKAPASVRVRKPKRYWNSLAYKMFEQPQP
jgi:hypothetical protein